MAQQGPSFTDKHIEKVFLAVGALILLIAILAFGLSPREVVVRGQSVAPGEVDITLAREAETLRNRVENDRIKPSPAKPTGLKEEIAVMQDQPLLGLVLPMTSFGPALAKQPGPATIVPPAPVSVTSLVGVMPAPNAPEAIQPDKAMTVTERVVAPDPAAVSAMSVPVYDPGYGMPIGRTPRTAGTEIVLSEDKTIHVLASYDWNRLRDIWMDALKSTIIVPEIVATSVELQVESRPVDSAEEWREDGTVNAVRRPTVVQGASMDGTRGGARQVRPFSLPPIPDFTGENGQEVKAVVRYLGQPQIQSWVLQPDYWDVWLDDSRQRWTAVLDIEKIRDMYKVQPAPATAGTPAATPVAMGNGMTPPAMEMMYAGVAGRRDAQGLPGIAEQLNRGKVLMYSHVTNLEYGREYRCRMRLQVVNPLLAYPDSAKPQTDASIKTVNSPWSDWSNPVKIDRQVRFFLTGVSSLEQKASVTAYATVLGQRVRRTISDVRPGRLIADRASVSIVDPTRVDASGRRTVAGPSFEEEMMMMPPEELGFDPFDPMAGPPRTAARRTERKRPVQPEVQYVGDQAVTQREVDFDTGAIALELSFDRRVRSAVGNTRDDGVELVYLDENGQLATSVMTYDEALQRPLEAEAKLVQQRVTAPRRRTTDRTTRGTEDLYGRPVGMEPGGIGTGRVDPRTRDNESGSESGSGRSSRVPGALDRSGRSGPDATGVRTDPRAASRDEDR